MARQYLFSTDDYNENMQDLKFEDEDITLHEINDLITNNVIFIGTSKVWNGIYAFAYYGNFIQLYNNILQDCDNYEIYIENNLLNIYGIHHDGYVKAQVYLLTDEGNELYQDWQDNISNQNMTESQIIKYILNKHCYFNFGEIFNKEFNI